MLKFYWELGRDIVGMDADNKYGSGFYKCLSNDLKEELTNYEGRFDAIKLGAPLLTSDEDFDKVIDAITKDTESFNDGKTLVAFMGHGTEAESNGVYAKMQKVLSDMGMANYFIGTVEAEPSVDDVLALVQAGSYKRVVLRPMMVVAGDHANNDMAGDEEDSLKNVLSSKGYNVHCVLKGLGEIDEFRELFVNHVNAAIEGQD